MILYLPHWVETDTSLKISVIFIFTLVVVSVVVITGWAGQVSLCQVAFMAVGATVGARAPRTTGGSTSCSPSRWPGSPGWSRPCWSACRRCA